MFQFLWWPFSFTNQWQQPAFRPGGSWFIMGIRGMSHWAPGGCKGCTKSIAAVVTFVKPNAYYCMIIMITYIFWRLHYFPKIKKSWALPDNTRDLGRLPADVCRLFEWNLDRNREVQPHSQLRNRKSSRLQLHQFERILLNWFYL